MDQPPTQKSCTLGTWFVRGTWIIQYVMAIAMFIFSQGGNQGMVSESDSLAPPAQANGLSQT